MPPWPSAFASPEEAIAAGLVAVCLIIGNNKFEYQLPRWDAAEPPASEPPQCFAAALPPPKCESCGGYHDDPRIVALYFIGRTETGALLYWDQRTDGGVH